MSWFTKSKKEIESEREKEKEFNASIRKMEEAHEIFHTHGGLALLQSDRWHTAEIGTSMQALREAVCEVAARLEKLEGN